MSVVMVLCFIVVDFVDWYGLVDDVWLNSLLLDDWLNCLVDVMVHVLSGNGGFSSGSLLALNASLSALVSSTLGIKAAF